MNIFGALIAPVTGFAAAEAKAAASHVGRRVAIYGAMALLGLGALAFLLVALNVYLTGLIGAQAAPLIVALGLMLLMLAVLLAGNIWIATVERGEKTRQRRRQEFGSLTTTAAVTAIPLLMQSAMLRRLLVPAAAIALAYLGTRNVADSGEDLD